MSNSLMSRLAKNSESKFASALAEADHLTNDWMVSTQIPTLNIALSGSIHGGVHPGVTTIAGESKTFKTTMALIMAKAYLDATPDSIVLFYDCEFGARKTMLENVGIDTNRVFHTPFTNLEELRNDLVGQLDQIKPEDNVFILIDSIGNTASKKEVDDALSGNAAEDMTRARKLKSLYRIITPQINLKKIPMVGINHVYKDMAMYPQTHMSGGQGPMLSSDTVLFMTRQKMKEGTQVSGHHFNMKVEKSRFVKEQSKIPISVHMEEGIYPWSGLLDMSLDMGYINSPTKGFYQLGDTGKKMRRREIENMDFWKPILKDPEFDKEVKEKFQLSDLTIPTTSGDVVDQLDDEGIQIAEEEA